MKKYKRSEPEHYYNGRNTDDDMKWYFVMSIKFFLTISVIASLIIMAIFADIWKLIAVLAFLLFFSLIYLGMS